MTLFDFMKQHASVSEDTSDDIYDAVVTVDWERDYEVSEEFKIYHDFCENVYKSVEFVEVNKGGIWIVKWSKFIQDNLDFFRKWSKDYWRFSIDDWEDDDLVYEWISEIHKLLAGCGTDSIYKKFNENLFKEKIS